MEKKAGGRRVVKLLTMVGGLVALLWALRDRLISIPTEREEARPSFRATNGQHPEPPST
ncbi:MAG TPA: hypothetical protein VJ930_10610 [Acidimicrobiia bacterium]|nr:hypothetical protein [Acidimicrobiia bacterium]